MRESESGWFARSYRFIEEYPDLSARFSDPVENGPDSDPTKALPKTLDPNLTLEKMQFRSRPIQRTGSDLLSFGLYELKTNIIV